MGNDFYAEVAHFSDMIAYIVYPENTIEIFNAVSNKLVHTISDHKATQLYYMTEGSRLLYTVSNEDSVEIYHWDHKLLGKERSQLLHSFPDPKVRILGSLTNQDGNGNIQYFLIICYSDRDCLKLIQFDHLFKYMKYLTFSDHEGIQYFQYSKKTHTALYRLDCKDYGNESEVYYFI